jgi:ATP-dependent Clp protease ATP-binding subunit ClpC
VKRNRTRFSNFEPSKKNNPFIGEPGVGKSAIAEGLALRIIQKKVSRTLFNKRVVTWI